MPRRSNYRKKPSVSGRARRNATQEYVMRAVAKPPALRYRKSTKYHPAAVGAGLMPCSKKYLQSLLDPSGDAGRGACVPSGFPIPSQKVRAFVRGTLSTGTGGNGYIMWSPALVNDQGQLTVTQAGNTAAGNVAFDNIAYTGTNSSSFQNKLPYTTAQLTAGQVQARIVSGCIRVRYAGSEQTRSGIITMLEDPDHLALTSSNPQSIASFEGANRERPNGDGAWSQLNWSGPAKTTEVEYVQTAFQTGPSGQNVMMILITGTNNGAGALGPATFEFESWINVEYIGRDVVGKTDNVNDQRGMDKVISATKTVANTAQESLNPTATSTVSRLVDAHSGAPTMAGDVLEGVAGMIHPTLGRLWSRGRSRLRSFSQSRSRSRSSRSRYF